MSTLIQLTPGDYTCEVLEARYLDFVRWRTLRVILGVAGVRMTGPWEAFEVDNVDAKLESARGVGDRIGFMNPGEELVNALVPASVVAEQALALQKRGNKPSLKPIPDLVGDYIRNNDRVGCLVGLRVRYSAETPTLSYDENGEEVHYFSRSHLFTEWYSVEQSEQHRLARRIVLDCEALALGERGRKLTKTESGIADVIADHIQEQHRLPVPGCEVCSPEFK